MPQAANYTDANGITWSKDKYYSGGSSTLGAMPINNTTDAALYYDRRFGKSFSYAIPVVPGDYTLNLSFADSGYKVGPRTFNVFAEGSQILSNYDIARDGENLVITKSFHVTVTDGTLNISFAGIVGNATLSTIEVIPSIPIPVIQWQTAASSPVVHAESLGGVIDGKLYVFGGFQNGPNNSIIASCAWMCTPPPPTPGLASPMNPKR